MNHNALTTEGHYENLFVAGAEAKDFIVSTQDLKLTLDRIAENLPPVGSLEFDKSAVGLDVGVTVVFPCLNEEEAVGQCVRQSLEVMFRAGYDGHVIVVDNGSTDDSVNRAIAAGAEVIVQREPGYGAALRSGFEAATTEFVIMADADGTYELDAIPRLLAPLLEGEADMVLGQRLNDATVATMPWLHRYVGTPVITYLVRRATKNRLTISDSQSGFRAFRRDEVVGLNLSSTGMEFASEMLIRSARADFRVTEVDTKYAERIGESTLNTFSDGLRHLRQILILSPQTVAAIPGVIATILAGILWVVAARAGFGAGGAGSLSWTTDSLAEILSIVGPLVFCTGVVLRYRTESIGLTSTHMKTPLEMLIRRFFVVGSSLVTIAAFGFATMIANSHYNPGSISRAGMMSVSSFLSSVLVVGLILAAAPLISPFLTTSPRMRLPMVEVKEPWLTVEALESHS